jgi:hypothetical protein
MEFEADSKADCPESKTHEMFKLIGIGSYVTFLQKTLLERYLQACQGMFAKKKPIGSSQNPINSFSMDILLCKNWREYIKIDIGNYKWNCPRS